MFLGRPQGIAGVGDVEFCEFDVALFVVTSGSGGESGQYCQGSEADKVEAV